MFILVDILPLLVIPLVIYNLMILGPVIGPVADAQAWLAQPLVSSPHGHVPVPQS